MVRSVLASALLLSIACGHSLKQAQRSEEAYEQCYGADYNPAVTPAQRGDCWAGWLRAHSAAEPPERIRYAEMRLHQLAIDGSTRPLPADAPEPLPVYEHEYPRPPPSEYQLSGCNPLCNDRWASCNSHCEFKDKTCVAACESEFRVCVDGCP
ncbi:MAG: hypothetical protein KJN97_19520 [Deltaproteobacteria bacterium]|nr:hypothetical protein [Deltaproteobacteria bacterium]